MQQLTEKLPGAFVSRRGEKRVGSVDLDYFSTIHENHPIGYSAREAHFMGDDDHRHAVSG